MVAMAKERLQNKVANHPIGFELLPPKFTLPQLQSLYEAIYESTLDKRNFTRKILGLGILNKLEEKEKESSRKEYALKAALWLSMWFPRPKPRHFTMIGACRPPVAGSIVKSNECDGRRHRNRGLAGCAAPASEQEAARYCGGGQ